ncbi:GNAT family N-acetyltransferase [Flavobacterium haoranii]|uniref:Protein N-acetyltransferase, RimJ/RimL family n=1 Tax=Flavobacterium haoranii TaxID=683124 RepID=A0A1M6BQN5_9FLAO|nr:GNAT family N-acetyltransferase [Flavobacterium haoranii]SHI51022.1 Protein N-acetyltransferase, RimJ/RimL family [Flavobacterium haoranii]
MNLQPILSNEEIILIPLVNEDFEALYYIASDKLLWEQHPNNDRYKKEVFEDFFKKAIESKGAFTIYEKTTNKIVGSTRFYDLEQESKSVFIGFTFIDRKFWGSSLNGKVKKLMIDYAFQFVDRVKFHVGETNYRSQKAVEKLGALKIGTIQKENSEIVNWIYELKKTL